MDWCEADLCGSVGPRRARPADRNRPADGRGNNSGAQGKGVKGRGVEGMLLAVAPILNAKRRHRMCGHSAFTFPVFADSCIQGGQMRRKEPWFKFWATDYLTDPDVDALTLEAQGLLVRMWCVCSQRGNIPEDPEEIARLTRCKRQIVSQCASHCKPFFKLRDGLLYSERMEREKEKSETARANAEKRYKKGTRTPEYANGTANGIASGTAKGVAQKARRPESQEPELTETSSRRAREGFRRTPHNFQSRNQGLLGRQESWDRHAVGRRGRQSPRNMAAGSPAHHLGAFHHLSSGSVPVGGQSRGSAIEVDSLGHDLRRRPGRQVR